MVPNCVTSRTVYTAEVTRYHVAVKYFALKALRGAERAMDACEPEDQANYGISSLLCLARILESFL